MFQLRFIKWSHNLHKWVGVYISILVAIWLVEMMVLPTAINPGFPTLNHAPLAIIQSENQLISLEQALQSLMHQQPDGLASAVELDEMAYLPKKGVYRFAIRERYLEWYVEAKTGKIVTYGFDSNRFLMEKAMLGWTHPIIAKVVKGPFHFLFVFLAVTGCYIVFYPRRKRKRRQSVTTLSSLKKGQVAVVRGLSGEQRFISRVSAMGFTPDTQVTIVQNSKRGPLLAYLRDTQVALGHGEAAKIQVEGVEK